MYNYVTNLYVSSAIKNLQQREIRKHFILLAYTVVN
jgi:hypothetical protein